MENVEASPLLTSNAAGSSRESDLAKIIKKRKLQILMDLDTVERSGTLSLCMSFNLSMVAVRLAWDLAMLTLQGHVSGTIIHILGIDSRERRQRLREALADEPIPDNPAAPVASHAPPFPPADHDGSWAGWDSARRWKDPRHVGTGIDLPNLYAPPFFGANGVASGAINKATDLTPISL